MTNYRMVTVRLPNGIEVDADLLERVGYGYRKVRTHRFTPLYPRNQDEPSWYDRRVTVMGRVPVRHGFGQDRVLNMEVDVACVNAREAFLNKDRKMASRYV